MNGKELSEIIKARRSIRQFLAREIPPQLLADIIETAATAPSAGNRRDWEFTVIVSPEIKQQMLTATKAAWDSALNNCETEVVREELGRYRGNIEWFAAAPALVAISCKKTPLFMTQMFSRNAEHIAGGTASAFMAAQNLLLAAHGHGLAGCCLTGPLAAAEEFKLILQLDRRREIVCLIALGYPADDRADIVNQTKPTMRIV